MYNYSASMDHKLYIAEIQFGTWQKRLFLDAVDSAEMELRFNQVHGSLPELTQRCSDWPGFWSAAVERFVSAGFMPVKH